MPPLQSRTAQIVAGTVLALVFGVGIVSRIATGQLFWLNAKHQPVSIFLVIPVLVIGVVIMLLNLFVWRRQRRAAEGRRGKRH